MNDAIITLKLIRSTDTATIQIENASPSEAISMVLQSLERICDKMGINVLSVLEMHVDYLTNKGEPNYETRPN